MKSDGKLLGVFTKQPTAGNVKTRLAAATSPQWAERVAQAFLEDSLDRFSQIDASRTIAYAPVESGAYLAEISQGRFDLTLQHEGDLAQRLHHFFAQARLQGYARIIAVGTDSPTLPIAYIEHAFQLLQTHDVVIGPAFDGGYYLIGTGPKDV